MGTAGLRGPPSTRWSGRQPDLARFASPAELVAAAHDRADAAARADLEGLTQEAATDPLAARTVLQALLPGLTRLARDNATAYAASAWSRDIGLASGALEAAVPRRTAGTGSEPRAVRAAHPGPATAGGGPRP